MASGQMGRLLLGRMTTRGGGRLFGRPGFRSKTRVPGAAIKYSSATEQIEAGRNDQPSKKKVPEGPALIYYSSALRTKKCCFPHFSV